LDKRRAYGQFAENGDPGAAGVGVRKDKKLIITADDFGLSLPVNEAVESAHRTGVLSAASLMVGAPAMDDAVERARKLPTLGVGLHVTLLNGRPVLPREKVPGLVGSQGRFPDDPIRLGVTLYASSELRRQANAEIEAQFERFGATGIVMDHINGHQHFHLHPVVLEAIARLAPRFGHPPLRLPLEPFRASFEANRDRIVGRFSGWLFYSLQARRIKRRLMRDGMTANDYVFGLYDSGAMTEDRVLRLLEHLPQGVSEIYCHPATRRWGGADALPTSYQPVAELNALLSPAVKAKIAANRLQLLTYRAALS
jgi:hopanoid biosynthesis associated protein HpnK